MAEFDIPKGAYTQPGPCPKCGDDALVLTVRSKTDRNWWDEWKGCMECVDPVVFLTQFMDQHGEYTLTVPGGPAPRELRRKRAQAKPGEDAE